MIAHKAFHTKISLLNWGIRRVNRSVETHLFPAEYDFMTHHFYVGHIFFDEKKTERIGQKEGPRDYSQGPF